MADKIRKEAAERYAEKHGITISQTYRDENFRALWNIFRQNPNSKLIRRHLGITQRRLQKESANESDSFRSLSLIRRHTVNPMTNWIRIGMYNEQG